MEGKGAVSSAIAIAGLVACSSFGDTPSSPGTDAGTGDGAASSSGTASSSGGSSGDGGSSCADGGPKSTCAMLSGFLLCSDFDESNSVQQPTKPNGKPWLLQQSPNGTLTIGTTPGFSAPN